VDVFAKGTGGEEFSYVAAAGWNRAIEDMGEVLHAQYTITYSPNNADEPGFHQIAVDVIDPNSAQRAIPAGLLAGSEVQANVGQTLRLSTRYLKRFSQISARNGSNNSLATQ